MRVILNGPGQLDAVHIVGGGQRLDVAVARGRVDALGQSLLNLEVLGRARLGVGVRHPGGCIA